MGYVFLSIVLLIGLWYLVVTRKINPDNFFKRRTGPISITHININQYNGGMRITADLDNEYKTIPSGKMRYSINNGYALYNDEYSFEVDENNNFRLIDIKHHKAMALGKIVDKAYQDYSQSYLYKIKLMQGYQGFHVHARGIFPYYVPIQFTMMTSGGMKYSHEELTRVISPKGDTLKLYQNYGHMDSGEKTGIYNGW